MGVFGLVIFELQGREKEIAVRKVHGSTVRQILWMLNSSFLRITLVCFIISIPLAYYGVNVWLRSFAYKNADLHMGIFSGFGNHNDTDRIYGYFPELSGGDGESGV